MQQAARSAYHHGALRSALIEAAEGLLAERGPDAFSLREVARRAGVSAAAPAHHFGDAAGLLTAVATLGFEGLTQALREGDARGGADPIAALREQGLGYVNFALGQPGQFRLMFRDGLLQQEPALISHAAAAFDTLAAGVRRVAGLQSAMQMRPAHWTQVLALWSIVHGYAHLAIAGKLARFAHLSGGTDAAAFVAATLPAVLDGAMAGLFATPAAQRQRARKTVARPSPVPRKRVPPL